jgi:hypothetical protein
MKKQLLNLTQGWIVRICCTEQVPAGTVSFENSVLGNIENQGIDPKMSITMTNGAKLLIATVQTIKSLFYHVMRL